MVSTTQLIKLRANFKQLIDAAYKGFCELSLEHPNTTIHASLPLTQEELTLLGPSWIASALHARMELLRNPNEYLLWGLRFPDQPSEPALRLQYRVQLIDAVGNPL